MGCCDSAEIKYEKVTSKSVERELQINRNNLQKMVKLLFLGRVDSGKKTFFKQLRALYGYGYTERDRRYFKHQIKDQCLQQMQLMTETVQNIDVLYNQLLTEEKDAIDTIQCRRGYTDERMKYFTKYLWDCPTIKEIYEFRNMLGINLSDSTEYFLDQLDRINQSDYIPTMEDILLVNSNIIGIMEMRFDIDGKKFLFVNNHQNSEMRKWLDGFEFMDGIIFVASLSCYDSESCNQIELLLCGYVNDVNVKLPEALMDLIMDYYILPAQEPIIDKMGQQLELFAEIVNDVIFVNAKIFLILNKKDLFEQKVKSIPITVCSSFKDYTGDRYSYQQSINFIQNKFLSLNKDETKVISTSFTCATDIHNVQKQFNCILGHL